MSKIIDALEYVACSEQMTPGSMGSPSLLAVRWFKKIGFFGHKNHTPLVAYLCQKCGRVELRAPKFT